MGALLALPAVAVPLAAQRLEYSAALSAARGTFVFPEATTTWVLDQGLVLGADRWRLSVNVPLIRQNSSVVTWVGGLPLPTGGPNAGALRGRTGGGTIPMQRRRGAGGGTMGAARSPAAALFASPAGITPAAATVDSGFVEAPGAYATRVGDPVLHAATELALGERGATRIGASLVAKLPVADPATGVGTGEFDYGAGLSLSFAGSRAFAFGDVTHWVLGDLPDLPLRDLTTGIAGAGIAFGEMGRVSLMATVSGATSAIAGVEAPVSVGGGIGLRVRERRSLTLTAAAGLSESSPDWSVAIGWRDAVRWR